MVDKANRGSSECCGPGSVGLTGQNANQRNVKETEADDFEPAPNAHVRTVRQQQVRLTEAQISELINARLPGITINQLAEQFCIHRTTVMRHLNEGKVGALTRPCDASL